MDHKTARAVVLRAWQKLYPGAEPPPPLLAQAMQSIGLFEGTYGEPGRPPQWRGSNNWGAVHSSDKPPCVPGQSFLFEDANSPVNAAKTPQCFKVYPTPEDGAADAARNFLRTEEERAAFASGDADRMALAMFDARYFLGENRDPDPAVRRQKNAASYASGIARAAERIAKGVGEPLFVTRKGGDTPPVVAPPPRPGTPGPQAPPPAPVPPIVPASPPGESASAAPVVLFLVAAAGALFLVSRR